MYQWSLHSSPFMRNFYHSSHPCPKPLQRSVLRIQHSLISLNIFHYWPQQFCAFSSRLTHLIRSVACMVYLAFFASIFNESVQDSLTCHMARNYVFLICTMGLMFSKGFKIMYIKHPAQWLT